MTAKRNDNDTKEREPSAQPACVDTHSPPLGSSMLSTIWPSASSTNSRATPSSAGYSLRSRAADDLRGTAWHRDHANVGVDGRTHRRVRSEIQSVFENNCERAELILAYASIQNAARVRGVDV
jgi:hypothetical protein